jgi:hypothetical protein
MRPAQKVFSFRHDGVYYLFLLGPAPAPRTMGEGPPQTPEEQKELQSLLTPPPGTGTADSS